MQGVMSWYTELGQEVHNMSYMLSYVIVHIYESWCTELGQEVHNMSFMLSYVTYVIYDMSYFVSHVSGCCA